MSPLHIATPRLARLTFINTFLIIIAILFLLGTAISAYFIFYSNFVPQVEIEKVVNLQYGDGPHPYALIPISSSELVSRQAYDIFLSLHLPRSPQNLKLGNFMTTLALLHPAHKFTLDQSRKLGISGLESPLHSLEEDEIIFSSRRAAIMSYASLPVSLTSRILTLPLYLLGLFSEAETLNIKIAEAVTFLRGWKNIPNLALLEIQAGQEIQIYEAVILFRARFSGMRWLMYNHRIISFVLFTVLFWISTIFFAGLTWAALIIFSDIIIEPTYKNSSNTRNDVVVKTEESASDEDADLSDTPRTFPTYGRQPALRFVPTYKEMKDSADDEDDKKNFNSKQCIMTDSGIGTSLDESKEKTTVRRKPNSRNYE
ncbi:Seipin-like protein [Golovinomyces cichoracearum]|uniref:Seipin-like protein n=1 Tax=Golovinomyces cichoracearum TaxID=62708 RepID=A0A420IZN2_9PEZI|nr:Seipin-like protein [Golovinomyces cichoracearum]